MAATVFSLTISWGTNKDVTKQSWQAISRIMQVSQLMIMISRYRGPLTAHGADWRAS
jgi:hypothetical protein